jgi:AraC-like DNA-binding protein
MNISITNILFVLVIFQLLFLSLFLFTQKKGKRISNLLLGCFYLTISLNLLDVFLLLTGAYISNPYLAGWGSCLPLLFGPTIYFYTQSVLNKDFSITFKKAKHLFPFIIFFSCTEIYFLAQPVKFQERVLSDILQHHLPWPVSIVSTLIFIQFLLYIIASLREVSLFKKAANQHFSNKKQTEVSWLFSTIIFFWLIVIITIVNGLLVQTSWSSFYLVGFNLIILAMLVFIVTVLLKALQKPYFLSFAEESDSPSLLQTSLTDSESIEKEKMLQMILIHMQNNKPFLEPELTLDQLASQLFMKPRVLSQTINEVLGQNFYDFVNHFRIEEASHLLTNPKDKKITVLEVLYAVGFNSKSSFNTLFKKYTGSTPTDFRKKQLL